MSKPCKSKALCRGCRDDFYNGQGASECWSFKDAKVVTRYRIDWWTQPTTRSAFTKVATLDCHYAPGKYGHYKELPAHLAAAPAPRAGGDAP